MCWPASFPVISTVCRVARWIGVLEDLLPAWGIFYFRAWIHHYPHWRLERWATHAVADLYRKSGSDGQGHVPLLQTHLAPDPTEGETPTWIIFPVKSINIACNHWHSPFPRHRVCSSALLSTDTCFELRSSISILETMITSEAFRNTGFIPNNASDQSSQWPRTLASTQKELLRFSWAWPVLVISFYWTLRTPPSC